MLVRRVADKHYHLMFESIIAVMYACMDRSTDPVAKTNENGPRVKAFLSRGLKAFVWLFYAPSTTGWVAPARQQC